MEESTGTEGEGEKKTGKEGNIMCRKAENREEKEKRHFFKNV